MRHVFSLKTALGGLFLAYGASRAVESFIEASDEQAKAVIGMETALRSMGRYTPELSRQLQDLASSLQNVTNFGDEATLQGIKFLVTYKNITNDLLPQTVKTMLDLAALMGGDVVRAANTLGKASMGLTGELTRMGISVDKNTYKMYGFAGVLRQIMKQANDQAVAVRMATGSHIALGMAIGDLKEKVGDVLKDVLEPSFRDMIELTNRFSTAVVVLRQQDLSAWAESVRTHVDALTRTAISGIEKVGTAIFKLWDFAESHPDVLKFGLVGLIFRGKVGLGIGATLGYAWELAGKMTELEKHAWRSLFSRSGWRGHGASGTWGEPTRSMSTVWKEFMAALEKTPTESEKAFAKLSTFASDFVKEVRSANLAISRTGSAIHGASKGAAEMKKDLEGWVEALKVANDPLYRLRKEMEKLNQAKMALSLSAKEYGKLMEYVLGDYASSFVRDVRDLSQSAKNAFDTMSQYAVQAARSMQSAFSDFFFDIMQGKFGDLAFSFKATIDRMVADALAARLAEKLFGNYGKTGKIGGLVGELRGAISHGIAGIFRHRSIAALSYAGGIPAGMSRVWEYAQGGIIWEPVLGIGAKTGRQYLIGEKGPEEISPVSVERNKNVNNVTVNINVTTPDADSFRRSQRQIIEKARQVAIGGLGI